MKTFNSENLVTTAATILSGRSGDPAAPIDERINSSLKDSYVFQTFLKDDPIQITMTHDGLVILTGTVSEWSHRLLAEETAARLPGVMRMENNLEPKDEPPAENNDAALSQKVKTMLMLHRDVNGINMKIEVREGVVSLWGEALSKTDRNLTSEYVNDIKGVQQVINKMSVGKGKKLKVENMTEQIDDPSITAQVKIALLLHESTSGIKVKVETKNGIVTLTGIVRKNTEKDLVGELVHTIRGVKDLKIKLRTEKEPSGLEL